MGAGEEDALHTVTGCVQVRKNGWGGGEAARSRVCVCECACVCVARVKEKTFDTIASP